jgi:hypothetical protein
MFEPMFKPNPSPYKAGKNARQVQIRECFPQPLKERLDEGREMRRGKENAFGDRDFFHRKRIRPRMVYVACYLKGTRFFDRGDIIAGPSPRSARWPIGIAAFGLCLPFIYNKEFRLGPGKRWQQQKGRGPCSCCARPLLSQWGSRFGIY